MKHRNSFLKTEIYSESRGRFLLATPDAHGQRRYDGSYSVGSSLSVLVVCRWWRLNAVPAKSLWECFHSIFIISILPGFAREVTAILQISRGLMIKIFLYLLSLLHGNGAVRPVAEEEEGKRMEWDVDGCWEGREE